MEAHYPLPILLLPPLSQKRARTDEEEKSDDIALTEAAPADTGDAVADEEPAVVAPPGLLPPPALPSGIPSMPKEPAAVTAAIAANTAEPVS